MNKKLLAVAVGATLAASPMFANAAATVYGTAHLSVDSVTSGLAGSNGQILTLASNSSFIGFKADEDLGGGMKAIFGAEWQVGFDSASPGGTSNVSCGTATTGTAIATCTTQPSASAITNRNVFVGLTGGFGTVRLGNYDDIMKQVGRKVDLFKSEQIGESRALVRGAFGGSNNLVANWDERLANSVNYESPTFGGVMITGNYGMENTDIAGNQVSAHAIGAQFNMGPVYVGAAYKNIELSSTTSSRAHRISASFNPIKPLRLVGLYQSVTDEGGINERDRATWGAGAAFDIGNGTIKGQYYYADANGGGKNSASLLAVGYDHNLSKNTVVYVTYAQVDNSGSGRFNVIGAGHMNPQDATMTGPANDKDPRATSIGMRMAF